MSLLQQVPVLPQVPGYPVSYAPDKIPPGAVIAFMPVVILPESAYAGCSEDAKQHYQQFGSSGLGVQPSPIPASFNSLFGGHAQHDQCMCPCSCTQNLPERFHKKRETSESDVAEASSFDESVAGAESKPVLAVEEVEAVVSETKNVVETTKLEPAVVDEVAKKPNDEAESAAATEEHKSELLPVAADDGSNKGETKEE